MKTGNNFESKFFLPFNMILIHSWMKFMQFCFVFVFVFFSICFRILVFNSSSSSPSSSFSVFYSLCTLFVFFFGKFTFQLQETLLLFDISSETFVCVCVRFQLGILCFLKLLDLIKLIFFSDFHFISYFLILKIQPEQKKK